MLVLGALPLIIGLAAGALTGDTTVTASHTADTASTPAAWVPIVDSARASFLPIQQLRQLVPTDTPHVRRKAVEVSDWYGRRLTIHRYVAYATVPVFAAQWVAGDQLFWKGSDAPTWAKTTHRVGATALAGMFTVNTVTGAWNWWDSRTVRQGRALRTIHALAMLTADAGFTWVGVKLANDAETSNDQRRLHREVALWCIGITGVSGIAMKLLNR